MKEIEVVAAVIVNDGKILATQRGYGDFKGKWEFPGGKVDKDETLEECIKREIKEETNADIKVKDFINTVEYDYPNFHLKMHSYICELQSDLEVVYHDEENLEHENMMWLGVNELDNLNWLPADVLVIDRLKEII